DDAFRAPRLALLEGRGRQAGCDLACPRAAHAVGDGEERRLEHVGVLVPEPTPPGVRDHGCPPDPHVSSRSSVSPTRPTSPGRSSPLEVTREPLTKVPFVEPRSCIQTPSAAASICACCPDANSSPSIETPLPGARPTTAEDSISTVVPCSRPGPART